ncbi:hypothetical protein GYMLUDRAFT_972542 [Collybiopsis luxurians FD-317 M1]|nr:hypothetical protein GYMLUDRAFT_972542 [Collybiopsis luxurians FD-317 M1]
MSETVGNLQAPRQYNDPSAKIWSIYLNNAEKDTARLTESWKGDMDAILIFAGLFSASVTAFIIESYKNLVPDNTDMTVILLAQIYRQLSNDTTLSGVIPPVEQVLDTSAFIPSTSSLVCNILWFLSLSLSLTAALSATLVQQWTRNYLQATVGREMPQQRARISTYLYEGLQRFHMQGIVAAIPMLLHASLLLFLAGLVEFLRPVNSAISYLIFGLLLASAVLYTLITFLPVFSFDCPYGTPLTGLWWKILRSMSLIRRRNSQGGFSPVPTGCSLANVREWEATDISYERDDRDFRAICWALEYSLDDSTLELFAEVIPDVVSGFDYSAKLLCRRLLERDDPTMRLDFRLTRLLGTCAMGDLDPTVAKLRSRSTLSAIWSLTMMAIPFPTTNQPLHPFPMPRDTLRFDERTLRFIGKIQKSIPDVYPYCLSAATAIARAFLDTLSEHALTLETVLSNYMRTGSLPERLTKLTQQARQNSLRQRDPRSMLDRISKEALDVERSILEQKTSSMLSASSSFYTSLGSLLRHLRDIATIVLREEDSQSLYVEEILHQLRELQILLRHAGFLLILDFIGYTLNGDSLPYETFNTTRRLYLRLNLESYPADASASFSPHSQDRLICYLQDALDVDHTHPNSGRLPEGVINMFLGLLRGINDSKCISKAENIIAAYTKVCTSPNTLEAAYGALAALGSLAPPGDKKPKVLDIYSEHMYSNAKLARVAPVYTRSLSEERKY